VTATFTVPALSPNDYTVSVIDALGNTATSGTQFTVLPAFGPATKLVFTRQPSGSSPNAPFATQPRITVQDADGNTVTDDASTVTLTITGGTPASGGPGTLSGCTQTESLGVITFSGCRIDTAGTGYRLHATSGGLAADDSAAFDVSVPPTAVSIDTTNSGTAGRITAGDTLVLTFSQAMSPSSILAGWNGSSTAVRVCVRDNNPDTLTVITTGSTCAAPTAVNLGSVGLGNDGWVSTTWVEYGTSSMAFNAADTVLTVTLSNCTATATGNCTNRTGTVAASTTLVWTPSAAATSAGGIAMSPAPVDSPSKTQF
jgi:hypothetical protein